MEHKIQSAERELKELCEALGLEFEQQDWGIVNADGRRFTEFMRYYEANTGLSPTQKFELAELILASANECLLSGSIPLGLSQFLVCHRNSFEAQLEYWMQLRDATEFPIGDWLRQHLVEASRE